MTKCHFADDIFLLIFLEYWCILISISLKLFPTGLFANKPVFVPIMAPSHYLKQWWPSLLTDITGPWWELPKVDNAFWITFYSHLTPLVTHFPVLQVVDDDVHLAPILRVCKDQSLTKVSLINFNVKKRPTVTSCTRVNIPMQIRWDYI